MEPTTETFVYEGRTHVCQIFYDEQYTRTVGADEPGKVFLCSGRGPTAMIVASGYLQPRGHVRFSALHGTCCRLHSTKSQVWLAAWDFFIQKINEMWQAARDGVEIPTGEQWPVPRTLSGGT